MTHPPDNDVDRVNPFAPPLLATSAARSSIQRKKDKPKPAAALNAVLFMSGLLSALGFFGFSGAAIFESVSFGLADALISALGLGLTVATRLGSATGYMGLLAQTGIAGALASYATVSGAAPTSLLPLKALLFFALFASLLSFRRRFLSQRDGAGEG